MISSRTLGFLLRNFLGRLAALPHQPTMICFHSRALSCLLRKTFNYEINYVWRGSGRTVKCCERKIRNAQLKITKKVVFLITFFSLFILQFLLRCYIVFSFTIFLICYFIRFLLFEIKLTMLHSFIISVFFCLLK